MISEVYFINHFSLTLAYNLQIFQPMEANTSMAVEISQILLTNWKPRHTEQTQQKLLANLGSHFWETGGPTENSKNLLTWWPFRSVYLFL
jgi:hypothetical protein